MANWALLQEQLVDRPVKKRAKYGIHFDNGDGTVTAHFSGKPCHYEDVNGIWQPIDTKLKLADDGFYGCPHSDVRVHKDGRVKVLNSDYSQFTELPSAKMGVLDGDRIVREFPGGRQYLYITENGFRQEIVVDKPTFPLEKFIAKSSGSLPIKYKESPFTAIDANGESYTFNDNVKEFNDWLDRAVYPVTIDPDFSPNLGFGGDVWLQYNSADNLGTYIYIKGAKNLMRFDLSSVPSGNICTAASLFLVPAENNATAGLSTYIYKITDANGDWVEGVTSSPAGAGYPCWYAKEADGSGGVTTAWAGSVGLQTAGTDYIDTVLADYTGTFVADTAFEVSFNASGRAVLQDWFGAESNNGLLLDDKHGSYIGSGENSTVARRPVLTVTYTAGGIPKHFLHYARLRSN